MTVGSARRLRDTLGFPADGSQQIIADTAGQVARLKDGIIHIRENGRFYSF